MRSFLGLICITMVFFSSHVPYDIDVIYKILFIVSLKGIW